MCTVRTATSELTEKKIKNHENAGTRIIQTSDNIARQSMGHVTLKQLLGLLL